MLIVLRAKSIKVCQAIVSISLLLRGILVIVAFKLSLTRLEDRIWFVPEHEEENL